MNDWQVRVFGRWVDHNGDAGEMRCVIGDMWGRSVVGDIPCQYSLHMSLSISCFHADEIYALMLILYWNFFFLFLIYSLKTFFMFFLYQIIFILHLLKLYFFIIFFVYKKSKHVKKNTCKIVIYVIYNSGSELIQVV